MADRGRRRTPSRRVYAAALAVSAVVHALVLFGPRLSPGPLPSRSASPVTGGGFRPLALVELAAAAGAPAAPPPRPVRADTASSAGADPEPPAEDAPAAAAPAGEPARSAASVLQPGYRDPRLYVRPGDAPGRVLDPYQRMAESLEERVAAHHDSVRAERRRRAEASRVRIFGVEVPLFGSAGTYRDPVWGEIQAQEEARRRAELVEERTRAARERRARRGGGG